MTGGYQPDARINLIRCPKYWLFIHTIDNQRWNANIEKAIVLSPHGLITPCTALLNLTPKKIKRMQNRFSQNLLHTITLYLMVLQPRTTNKMIMFVQYL